MRPSEPWSLLALVVPLALLLQFADGARSKPNILVILTDDQDYMLNSTHPAYMPNLDRVMRRRGLEVRQFVTSVASCCPSRTSLLTGRYCHNTNITSNAWPLGGHARFMLEDLDADYLPTWLQAAGYRTYLLGKFLNGFTEDSVYQLGCPRAWDVLDVLLQGDTGSAEELHYKDTPRFMTNCRTTESFDNQFLELVIRKKALDYIDDAASSGKPFFMMVNTFAPHDSIATAQAVPDVEPRYENLYSNVQLPKSPNFGVSVPKQIGYYWPVDSRDIKDQITARYRARLRSLRSVDDTVGALVAHLGCRGLLEDTIIIYTSDNGFKLGNHNIAQEKFTQYEEDVRLPFIMAGPGVPRGSATGMELQASMVDLTATIMSLAGASSQRNVVDGSPLPLPDLLASLASSGLAPPDSDTAYYCTRSPPPAAPLPRAPRWPPLPPPKKQSEGDEPPGEEGGAARAPMRFPPNTRPRVYRNAPPPPPSPPPRPPPSLVPGAGKQPPSPPPAGTGVVESPPPSRRRQSPGGKQRPPRLPSRRGAFAVSAAAVREDGSVESAEQGEAVAAAVSKGEALTALLGGWRPQGWSWQTDLWVQEHAEGLGLGAWLAHAHSAVANATAAAASDTDPASADLESSGDSPSAKSASPGGLSSAAAAAAAAAAAVAAALGSAPLPAVSPAQLHLLSWKRAKRAAEEAAAIREQRQGAAAGRTGRERERRREAQEVKERGAALPPQPGALEDWPGVTLIESWLDGVFKGKNYRTLRACTTVTALGPNKQSLWTCFKYTILCNRVAKQTLNRTNYELYDLGLDPYEIHDRYRVYRGEAWDAEQRRLIDRLDAVLTVMAYCKGEICRNPFLRIHPDGSVRTFTQAMDPQYDSLYGRFKKFSYKYCRMFYDPQNEDPDPYLAGLTQRRP